MIRRMSILAVWVLGLFLGVSGSWGQVNRPATSTAPAEAQVPEGNRKVLVLKARGMVGPGLADFLIKKINDTKSTRYELVVIELDTPGGLSDSMRDIIQAILGSDVPVATYVYPEGAHAGSAGTLIVIASHIAAMAPATNIGAAHPVDVGGGTISEKIVNDTAAYARSLAERRGRNPDWAEKAIRASDSIPATDAVKNNVVDLVASSLTDLLVKVDGRKIQIADQTRTLRTREAPVEYVEPTWMQNFLQVLGHPNIAYILLILGIWGLYFELANPGLIFPGVVGGVCLILGLLTLSVLPVNLAGLLLILLAVVLFTTDLFTPTHGILTVGGIISFLLGSLLLFPISPYGRVSWALILTGSGSTALFFLAVLWLVVKAHQSRVITGRETLAGAVGVAQSDLDPDGVVHVAGEQWSAKSVAGKITKGDRVGVVRVCGLTLEVRKATGGAPETE